MLDTNTKIKCPDCNAEILINTYQLLSGAKFSCSSCNLVVGLQNESKDTVSNALAELEKIKKQ